MSNLKKEERVEIARSADEYEYDYLMRLVANGAQFIVKLPDGRTANATDEVANVVTSVKMRVCSE